jgi:Tfp pilus assembly protein PilV
MSLIETLVAIAVMSVGLMSMALLMARMISTTSRSGFMSTAMQLASEKLEDLNRYPCADATRCDANVAVPVGATAGSLTADTSGTVTSDSETVQVDYWDEVRFDATGGAVKEIKTGVSGGGTTTYTTVSHAPDGTISTSPPSATAPSASGMICFRRRWTIEKDQPTPGVRRVTVLVTLQNPVSTPVSAQMSMVRP